jgi:hypothetical protein
LFFQGQRQFGAISIKLVGGGCAQGGVESEIGDFLLMGNAGLDIAAAFALCFCLGTAAGLLARQAVELRIEAAGVELLSRTDLLPAFPPLAFLGRLRNGLRTSFRLVYLGPFP